MGGRGASSGLHGRQSVIKNIEKKICKNKVETAYLIDTDGNIIFSVSDNSESYVTFSSEQLKLTEGKILTHNHPSGTTFSYEDIRLQIAYNIKEIRAASSNGTFSLMVDNKSKNYKEGDQHLAEAYKLSMELNMIVTDIEYKKFMEDYNAGQISREDLQNGCKLLNSQLADQRNQWLKENSHKYGYIYKFHMNGDE